MTLRPWFAVLVLLGCSEDWITGSTGDPKEENVLRANDACARVLGVDVRGRVTDEVYLVSASVPNYPGEKVPAAGWYSHGVASYWRPAVRDRSMAWGRAIAAHEVSHALDLTEGPSHDAIAERCASS